MPEFFRYQKVTINQIPSIRDIFFTFPGHLERLPEINCTKKTFAKSLGGGMAPWPPGYATGSMKSNDNQHGFSIGHIPSPWFVNLYMLNRHFTVTTPVGPTLEEACMEIAAIRRMAHQ